MLQNYLINYTLTTNYTLHINYKVVFTVRKIFVEIEFKKKLASLSWN